MRSGRSLIFVSDQNHMNGPQSMRVCLTERSSVPRVVSLLVLGKVISLIIVLVTSMLLATCSSSSPPNEADSTNQIEEVLTKARQAMSEAQSYRFIADLSIQTDAGVREAHFTGEWARPDRIRMRVEGLVEGTDSVQEVISVGGRVLVSDLDRENGAWTEPGPELYGISSLRITIPDLDDTVLLDDEDIDGLAMYHVTGTWMSEAVQRAAAGPVTSYDLFIGKEDLLLRRMVIESKFPELAESAPSEEDYIPISGLITYDFHGYNEAVTIELPTASE